MARSLNILVLCSGNSAGAFLAAALFRHHGHGRVRACSAASNPGAAFESVGVNTLERHGIALPELHSRSWDEFAQPGAAAMDFVFTVGAPVAGDRCPVWPGKPVAINWAIPDPARVDSVEARREAFERAFLQLDRRIRGFLAMDLFGMSARDIAAAAKMIHEACA